jgi:hypothetical protein
MPNLTKIGGDLPSPSSIPASGALKTSARPEDLRWQLVQRIAGSRSLGRSTLLSDFLLYICDRQLRGKGSEITEQRIGVLVFGRPEGYNSNEDNIVRNYARTLRKRIEEYFETEGTHETLRLEIPRGGYVPVFTDKDPASEPPSPPAPFPAYEAEPLPHPGTILGPATKPVRATRVVGWLQQPRSLVGISIASLAGVLVLGIAIGRMLTSTPSLLRLQTPVLASTDDGRNFVFWSHIFQQQRDTYIVPADGGLVMLQSFTRQPVTLGEYAKGNYRTQSEIAQNLGSVLSRLDEPTRNQVIHRVEVLGARRYTSIVDLDLTSQITRLQAVVPERFMIRYARDLRIDDLRSGNAILLGSSDANPWVELFQAQLNFRFDTGVEGGSQRIINQHPLPGEQPIYLSDGTDPQHRTYGVIALLPNLSNTGYVLIIEGVNMAGTQAAGDFVLSPSLMRPVLQKAFGPSGTIRPFELLVTTNDVAANASRPDVLSERFGLN